MGGERRKKEEREGRKGTEEGPTKNSCRGAQNVKLRHWRTFVLVGRYRRDCTERRDGRKALVLLRLSTL